MKEKQIKIDNLNINYKEIGNGDMPIVLLHGWGIDSDKYVELASILAKDIEFENLTHKFPHSAIAQGRLLSGVTIGTYRVILLDLPGFGKSDEPNENWNLDDYVEFTDLFIKNVTQVRGFELLKSILSKSNIKNMISGGLSSISNSETKKNKQIILIGHSFGGRIAIKYAVKYPEKIEKLILTGAAGIKHSLSKKQRLFSFFIKIGKRIFSFPFMDRFQNFAEKILYKFVSKKDYHKANPTMKEVMKNVIAEDLTSILEKIKTPTLLAWGKLDNSTPLSDGNLMNEEIENSKIIVFDEANHSLPYQRSEEFAKNILEFIEKSRIE